MMELSKVFRWQCKKCKLECDVEEFDSYGNRTEKVWCPYCHSRMWKEE